MQAIIQISTAQQKGLYDITPKAKDIVSSSGIRNDMVSVYVQGATAAIIIEFHMIGPLLANLGSGIKS